MRNIIRMDDISARNGEDRYFAVVSGQTTERLDADERELYNFMLGGFLSK
ncbi:hypothetical protein [Methanococcoides burtonii]|nr:hypothetical protein [Methanococcoides burtonii]